MDINQPVKLWQSIRKHPLRTILCVLVSLVVVVLGMWATGYFGEKGRQAASPQSEAPILKADPAGQEKTLPGLTAPPRAVARLPFDIQLARTKDRIRYLAYEYLHSDKMSLLEVKGAYGDNVIDGQELYDWPRVMEELQRQGFIQIFERPPGNIVFNVVRALGVESAPAKKEIATIEFTNARPFVDGAVLGDDRARKYWQVYYFKVQIHNRSDESTIRVEHLKLTDLRQLGGGVFKPWGNAEPVFIEWDGTKPKEIPPQDKVLVPFARIFPPELQRTMDRLLSGGVDTPQLRFTVPSGGWPRRMTSHVPPGTHRFRLTVFFENVPPAEVELELEWSGKQHESVESMAQEIKIRKL